MWWVFLTAIGKLITKWSFERYDSLMSIPITPVTNTLHTSFLEGYLGCSDEEE
jgi:hypothetical protein